MNRCITAGLLALFAFGAVWLGCGGNDIEQQDPTTTGTGSGAAGAGGGAAGSGGGTTGKGVGEPCTDTSECRAGLVCDEAVCVPGHTSGEGEPCVISAECEIGLYCAAGVCAPAGTGTDGDGCASDADCASGFRCALTGLAAVCVAEGAVDVGGSCQRSEECYGGLGCVAGACTVMPPGTLPFGPLWSGIECPEDSWPVEAYFRVPRGNGEDGDFYRLPIPNDVRFDGQHVDLGGHPTPGDALLGYDLVDRYLRGLETRADGWGVYSVTYFRFSGPVDFDTLQNHVRVVDVGTGATSGFYYTFVASRDQYMCGNRFVQWPLPGQAYRAGHTYAVYLTTDVKADNGSDITRPADLAALLADTAPAEATLAAQWPKYAGLRSYLAGHAIDPATILNATVFTVGHPQDVTERLAAAVAGAPPPVTSGWTKCDTNVTSPCPDATGERGCGAADPDFAELHALVTFPHYQEGTAPYLTPADGGDIATDASGDPVQTGDESVCVSLSVPAGAPPGGSWPTLIFAHGTGGHFRSHVVAGIAKEFAQGVDDGAGHLVRAAVLGIDQVAHGTRRGGTDLAPQDLFFNYANPLAVRGYPRQGAADQLYLRRIAPTVAFDAGSSPTGEAFALGSPIAFWGHSQGATLGALGVPYGAFAGLLLSGQGAGLRETLVTKRRPIDVAGVVPWVLGDPDGNGRLRGGSNHPVLSLMQAYVDPADPVAYARLAVLEPPGGLTPRHLFQPYGLADTYTPSAPQAAYAAGAGVELAAHDASVSTPEEIGWPPLSPMPTPIAGNRVVGATTVTAVVREYAPAGGDDGHFVVFDLPSARADAERFLAGVLGGTMPRVGP